MSAPYDPNKQGWGAALITCVLTAGLALTAYTIHNNTYRQPRDPMMTQVFHAQDQSAGEHGEAKGEEKAEAKAAEKSEAKTEAKTEEKADAKAEAAPVAKAETKAAAKHSAKGGKKASR